DYLEATLARKPALGCFGMHEWAMVYRDPNVRHQNVPLRLTRAETDAVVEDLPLACTHFDAFRFFSAAAAPRNLLALRRATTAEHDQPGCLHVNMDLYRFAYKIGPFCPSSVLGDAFELAAAARAVDMRASPYDLGAFGLSPLRIETATGRVEYVELQRSLFEKTVPIRERLLSVYGRLLGDRSETSSQAAHRAGG